MEIEDNATTAPVMQGLRGSGILLSRLIAVLESARADALNGGDRRFASEIGRAVGVAREERVRIEELMACLEAVGTQRPRPVEDVVA